MRGEFELSENILTDEEALQNFLLDIQCLDELPPWTGKFNLFDVLKVSRKEIRHSNILGWLMDPNENHGFGDAFLRGILQRLVENDTMERYDVFELLLSEMHSFSVFREWKNIDILLVSSDEKMVIAIENKVGSHEHSNQLNRYRKILEKNYAEYNRIYIYLTPDGEEPSDTENWDILSYTDVVEVLEELTSRVKLQQDVAVMIDNYITIIRRDIVEDQQLVEICNKIYSKHRRALDLIFENKIDEETQIRNAMRETLTKMAEEGHIIYEADWVNTVFKTVEMNKVLPDFSEDSEELSSWDSLNIYAYWLDYKDGRVSAVFELAGLNVPKKYMKNMQKIIDRLKPNDSRRDIFKTKQVFRTEWYEIQDEDDIEIEAEKAVRSAVNEILAMEKKLLKNIRQ